jgi:hypothetical protein
MFAKPKVTIVTGVVLLLSLTGCASDNVETLYKKSPSPTATGTQSPKPTEDEAKPLESILDYSKPIVLAKNDLEMEFLTIAVESCKKAQTHGFVVKTSEGESIFRPAVEGIWPDWPFDQVSIVDGKPALGEYGDLFFNSWPSLLDPCTLESAARSREPDDVYLEHKLVKVDDNTYNWAQHQGGHNLDEVTYKVENGLISSYDWNKGFGVTEISYGPLTDEQIALLDQSAN